MCLLFFFVSVSLKRIAPRDKLCFLLQFHCTVETNEQLLALQSLTAVQVYDCLLRNEQE